MGIDITTYRIQIVRFGPGRENISTGIAETYSSSITGSDIHYRMLATMVLLTFLLKCCVMTQQEGIMQDVYTFAGTDQCQLQYSLSSHLSPLTSEVVGAPQMTLQQYPSALPCLPLPSGNLQTPFLSIP